MWVTGQRKAHMQRPQGEDVPCVLGTERRPEWLKDREGESTGR